MLHFGAHKYIHTLPTHAGGTDKPTNESSLKSKQHPYKVSGQQQIHTNNKNDQRNSDDDDDDYSRISLGKETVNFGLIQQHQTAITIKKRSGTKCSKH